MANTPKIAISGGGVDMTPRVWRSAAVAASPAAASETIICTFTITDAPAINTGIELEGWAAFTAGTNAVSANLKIRQTGTSGTTIAATGATTVVATDLYSLNLRGLDTAAVLPNQVYVLTLTMASGSATSTVSACELYATII
jgi:hypothetical protein